MRFRDVICGNINICLRATVEPSSLDSDSLVFFITL